MRWRGFHGNLTSSLELARADENFADVTLACDDGFSTRAHRLVLASSSAYFARVLKQEAALETASDHRVIVLGDVDGAVLTAILAYIYVGQVFVPEDKLSSFFR